MVQLKVNPDTCRACKGRGQTRKTRTEMKKHPNGKLSTVALGSGCVKCRGTGLFKPTAADHKTDRLGGSS